MRRSMWVVVSGAVFFLTTAEFARWVDGRAALQSGASPDGIPVTHAAAMTAVFALTVTASALLLRACWWGAAGLTVLGAALGPMALLSPPWSASAEDLGSSAAPTGGRIVVGLVAAVWMSATAWYARGGGREPRAPYEIASYGVPLAAVLTGYFTVAGALTDPGHGDIGLGILLGWGMVTSGVVAAGLATARLDGSRPATLAVSLLPALALGVVVVMYGAYDSTGGWPTVAGWTLAQPPIYATVITARFVILAGVVAALVGPVVRLARPGTRRADLAVAATQTVDV